MRRAMRLPARLGGIQTTLDHSLNLSHMRYDGTESEDLNSLSMPAQLPEFGVSQAAFQGQEQRCRQFHCQSDCLDLAIQEAFPPPLWQ